jgi:nitrogen-specific signal transduction histidine kinase/DNA-binding NarL/FixJ family response regulator
MNPAHSILLLDSNEQSALDIQRFLKVSPHTFVVSHASDIQEGINYLKSRKADLILLDAEMIKGNDFVSFRQTSGKDNIPIIILSDSNPQETKRQADTVGAADYLVKNKINLFHLQKSIANVLKLSEAESKLDSTQSELNAHHETLYGLINKIDSGVLIINRQNTIRYANTLAYGILSEEGIRQHLSDYLSYRDVDEEEVIELKQKNNLSLNIRISRLEWKGEKANLFVLKHTKTKEERPDAFLQDDNLNSLLNSIHENVLLLKGEHVILANSPALQKLRLKQADVLNVPLKNLIETKEGLSREISVQSFLSEKEAEGLMKLPDKSTYPVTFLIKPLNLANQYYQLLTFSLKEDVQPQNIPGGRSDGDVFTSEGVLHLASHDLREPVRTILNYIQLVSENLQNKKYEQATEYAGFAKTAADGMEKLLSDLKTFIALNEYVFQLSKVSMKTALADVLRKLKPKIDKEGAEVGFAELPEVSGDRDLVEKLLYQLIDNALKFSRKGKKAVIDIGYDRFEGNIIFCVRDNGVGISKKYFPKIFEPFEKLNRVDEYPGNGLGLAICKKIVDIHRGELWVESLPGSGSNFYFTLKGK